MHMHKNVILTNKERTHARSNYTNTKLKSLVKAPFRHPARKRSGSFLRYRTYMGWKVRMTYKLDKFGVAEPSIAVCISACNDQLLFVPWQLLHVTAVTQCNATLQHLRQWDASLSLVLVHTRAHTLAYVYVAPWRNG